MQHTTRTKKKRGGSQFCKLSDGTQFRPTVPGTNMPFPVPPWKYYQNVLPSRNKALVDSRKCVRGAQASATATRSRAQSSWTLVTFRSARIVRRVLCRRREGPPSKRWNCCRGFTGRPSRAPTSGSVSTKPRAKAGSIGTSTAHLVIRVHVRRDSCTYRSFFVVICFYFFVFLYFCFALFVCRLSLNSFVFR